MTVPDVSGLAGLQATKGETFQNGNTNVRLHEDRKDVLKLAEWRTHTVTAFVVVSLEVARDCA